MDEIITIKLDKMNKSQLLLLRMVATFLINKNGSTTTLEIKDTLRERFPKMKWTQDEVSQAMIDIHDNQEFPNLQFEDTGDFRVYHMGNGAPMSNPTPVGVPTGATVSGVTITGKVAPSRRGGNVPSGLPTSQVATKPKKVKATPSGKTSTLSRTAVVDLMRESKGKFYTVTFTKVDGSTRVMNGQTKKSNFMDNLGYINFRESNGETRRVNPKTIQEISISGNVYKVK